MINYMEPITSMELLDDIKEHFGGLRSSHRDVETYLDWFYGLAYPGSTDYRVDDN
jgi:hypothetical protein